MIRVRRVEQVELLHAVHRLDRLVPMPAVPETGAVISRFVPKSLVGIFITPRDVFDISKYSLPSFEYLIMSIGRLPAPSSAIVVPRTLAPGASAAAANRTSGVQTYAAMMSCSPFTVIGRKVFTGERVSRRPCEPWKISTLVPRSPAENG